MSYRTKKIKSISVGCQNVNNRIIMKSLNSIIQLKTLYLKSIHSNLKKNDKKIAWNDKRIYKIINYVINQCYYKCNHNIFNVIIKG